MKLILFFSFFLIINIFLIQSNQNHQQPISTLISKILTETQTTRYYSSFDEAWIWNLLDQFSGSGYFGSSVSIYKEVLVIGYYDGKTAYVYRYNGTNFELEQTLNEPSAPNFGYSVSVYEDVIVIGAYYPKKAFIYRYNGTIWNLEQTLNQSATYFGCSVSIYENVTVIGADGANQAFIYRYNGTIWNLEQTFNESVQSFGESVSIYENVTVIGGDIANQAYVYRYNGTFWNLEQILNESVQYFGWSVSIYEDVIVIGTYDSIQVYVYRYNGANFELEQTLSVSTAAFGYSVSIYENVIVIGAYKSKKAYVYRYNGTFWNQEQTLNESALYFGYSVSNYGNFTAIGNNGAKKVFVYEANLIPQVNIVNCSSLFSSFDCYWDEIQIPNLVYQINYGYDWIDIDSPILEDGNVYYQQFNSSIYDNITGNEYYSIQIQACDNETSMKCECGNDYNISICGCRTQECEGEDKGEIVESSISLIFGEVTDFSCSISNSIDLNCNWNQPINCSIPFYYNLTYQSIYQNDSGNYQPTLSNQQFTVQFPNQEYQINVSACNSNGKCGYISTISITTDNLTSPIIYETISKIEEIEFNFTKLTNANNYSISLDNETNWEKFTSLDLSGNEIIGTISEISGNIEYNISIRGCVDLNCETPYLGLPSLINSTKAKLGNITSLNCNSLINGFVCSWDSLNLSSGLKGYSFTYNSISICLSTLTTNYSISGLNGGEYYEISIYSSADLNCSFNEYSGINSTTSITTLSTNESNDNSKTTAITLGIIIPIIVISAIIIGIILYKKKKSKSNSKSNSKSKSKSKSKNKEEKELHNDLDI
ncbi:hypothetical protein M0811_12232 [Anaeramoeba ignava]|uniref:Fibronectin type-III domain-containing protein n=1 Tax=Anaeramoeba ignava TaxID=1746090 RepID=A0A9Q0L9B3_ANAIG|nr:hypothetical protein M0811_12232 [Anaeramoeba ignava]